MHVVRRAEERRSVASFCPESPGADRRLWAVSLARQPTSLACHAASCPDGGRPREQATALAAAGDRFACSRPLWRRLPSESLKYAVNLVSPTAWRSATVLPPASLTA